MPLSTHSISSLFHDYSFSGRRTALHELDGRVKTWIVQEMEKEKANGVQEDDQCGELSIDLKKGSDGNRFNRKR